MTLEQILARKAELRELVSTRSANMSMEEIDKINKELDELEAAEKQARAKKELDKRMASMQTPKTVVEGNPEVKTASKDSAKALRGAQYKLKNGKAISLRADGDNNVEGTGQQGILIPSHLDPTVDALPWSEVNSVVDVVRKIPLANGSEYTKAFQVEGDEGEYTLEPTVTGETKDGVYHEVGVAFDKVTIKRNKITAITYESEELELLPDADYAAIVEANVGKSLKKKLAKEIILGNGVDNHFVGIAAPASTTGLNANTYEDKEYTLDENILINLLVDYGGEEDIEGKQLLLMNKQTIKDFAKIRDVNERPVFNISITGNTFTIDGYRGIFTSHLKPYATAEEGDIFLVYGNFSNYYMLDFGGDVIETSKEFKFDQGITAIRGKVFSGGNMAAYKAFLRATKGASETDGE